MRWVVGVMFWGTCQQLAVRRFEKFMMIDAENEENEDDEGDEPDLKQHGYLRYK